MEQKVNPLDTDNWQYMSHAGHTYNRHENHVIVNSDGIITWKEFSVSEEPSRVTEIKTALEDTIKGLISNGVARDVTHDFIAEEALETLVLTLASTSKTSVYERQALISECEFTFIEWPRDSTPCTIAPGWF